jgi:hypothetical protein
MPRYGGGVQNAPLPIMHPSMATVYRHRVVLDEIVLMPEEWRLQIDAKGDPAGVLGIAVSGTQKTPRSVEGALRIVTRWCKL